MGQTQNSQEFQLVLESLDFNDTELLTRVKGVLLDALELSIPEAKHVLENVPLTIKRSANEQDLIVHFNSLKEAGAKVLLLKPALSAKSEPSGESAFEFEIDLESVPGTISPPQPPKREPKAFTLDLDEHDSPLDALNNILTENQPKAAAPKAEGTPSDDDFSLEVLPAAEGLDLIDTDERANDIDESGAWGLNTLSTSLQEQKSVPAKPAEEEAKSDMDLINSALELDDGGPAGQAVVKSVEAAPPQPLAKPAKPADVKTGKTLVPSAPLDLQLDTEDKADTPPPPPPVSKPAATSAITPSPPLEMSLEAETSPHAPAKNEEVKAAAPEQPKPAEPPKQAEQPKIEAKPKPEPAPQPLATPPEPVKVAPRQSAEPRKNKARMSASKRTEITLIAAACILSGLILAGVNWFVISTREEPVAPAVTKNAIEAPLELSMQPKRVPSKPPLDKFFYKSEGSRPESTWKISFSSDGEEIFDFYAEISPAAPRELTPEEVVQGLKPLPWLRKVEVNETKFTKKEDGVYQLNGAGKVYVEQGPVRNRLIGDLHMEMKYRLGQGNPRLSLSVRQNVNDEEIAAGALLIELPENASPRFFLKSDFEFEQTEDPAKVKAQAETAAVQPAEAAPPPPTAPVPAATDGSAPPAAQAPAEVKNPNEG